MPDSVEKVTAFITRRVDDGCELLLFEHPVGGVQIPAGTVEPGEAHDVAVGGFGGVVEADEVSLRQPV